MTFRALFLDVLARRSRLTSVPATLRTTELHLLPWTDRDSQGLPYLGAELSVARFLDLFLHAGTFVRIIWLEPAGKGAPGNLVAGLPEAVSAKPELQRACMKGWQVLCVMNTPSSRVVDFFDIHGYRVTGHTDDPLHFNPVIRSIELKPMQSAVLFAHDGDPVYVMGVAGR